MLKFSREVSHMRNNWQSYFEVKRLNVNVIEGGNVKSFLVLIFVTNASIHTKRSP